MSLLTDKAREQLLVGGAVDAFLVAELIGIAVRVEKLAEKWRYKGEFGWGPWQEGYGPDHEGHILDQASAELRDALEGKS